MIPALVPRQEALRKAAISGFATATDLADYLVRAGLPFRDAHEVVGRAVAHAVAAQCDLAELSLETLQSFSERIKADVFEVLTVEGSVAARDHFGGTAPAQVRAAVLRGRERLAGGLL
jgi:argininosuccinate lyase